MLYLITLATDTPVVYFTTKFHKNDEFFSRNGNDLRNIPFKRVQVQRFCSESICDKLLCVYLNCFSLGFIVISLQRLMSS